MTTEVTTYVEKENYADNISKATQGILLNTFGIGLLIGGIDCLYYGLDRDNNVAACAGGALVGAGVICSQEGFYIEKTAKEKMKPLKSTLAPCP